MEYYSTMKWSTACYNMNEFCKLYANWKKSDTKGNIWFHLHEIFRTGKCMETECRLVVARGRGFGITGSSCLMDMGIYLGGMGMF